MIITIPAAYQLRHPEIENAPAMMAEFISYWRERGRDIGLVLQFQGEHFYRHLTHEEVEELQREEEPCGASTD